jgi:hypothetical protein
MESKETEDFIVSFDKNSGAVKDLAARVGTFIAKNSESKEEK